jgi:hypothetical protein
MYQKWQIMHQYQNINKQYKCGNMEMEKHKIN